MGDNSRSEVRCLVSCAVVVIVVIAGARHTADRQGTAAERADVGEVKFVCCVAAGAKE